MDKLESSPLFVHTAVEFLVTKVLSLYICNSVLQMLQMVMTGRLWTRPGLALRLSGRFNVLIHCVSCSLLASHS